MGKRFFVTADYSLMLALNKTNHNFSEKFFRFNTRNTFEADYVISRRNAVGVDFELMRTAMRYEFPQPKNIFLNTPEPPHEYAQITGQAYGLHFKNFNAPYKGAVAPVGNYSRIGLGLVNFQITPHSESRDLSIYQKPVTNQNLIMSYNFGKQRIILNSFIIRSGVQLGMTSGLMADIIRGYYQNESKLSDEEKFVRDANMRVFTYYLFNFNFGVGYLIPYRQS